MQLLSSCTSSAEELTFRVKRPCFYLSTKSCQQQGRTIILILRATPPKVRRGFISLCGPCGPIQGWTVSLVLSKHHQTFYQLKHWSSGNIRRPHPLMSKRVSWHRPKSLGQLRVTNEELVDSSCNTIATPISPGIWACVQTRSSRDCEVRDGTIWEGNIHMTMLSLGGLCLKRLLGCSVELAS